MDDITRRAYKSVGKEPPEEGEMTNGDYMHLSHEERMFFNGYSKGATDQRAIDEAELKPHWVSCRKRLPEKSGWYITIIKNSNNKKLLWYNPAFKYWSHYGERVKNIIYWMPLPPDPSK